MSKISLQLFCGAMCLILGAGLSLRAQEGGGDHDRPGGGYGNPVRPGPGGPDGPNGPKSPHHHHADSAHPDSTPGKANGQPHNALQLGPVGRWWDNKTVVQAVGLRKEQTKRMDAIFDANKPAILDNYKTFLKAQSNLTAVNKDPQANKEQVFAAIDAVNQARSSLQKATSSMLLQIRHEMDPEQIKKLESVP
jgi:Spy/CpxP family protein refolding chaperone